MSKEFKIFKNLSKFSTIPKSGNMLKIEKIIIFFQKIQKRSNISKVFKIWKNGSKRSQENDDDGRTGAIVTMPLRGW